MRNFYLMLILLLVIIPKKAMAQDFKALHVNYKSAVSGQEQVFAMLKIGLWHLNRYGHSDYPKSADSTWYYAKKCEELSITQNIPTSLGHTYGFYALLYNNIMDQDRSAEYAQRAIGVLEKTQDIVGLSTAYSRLLNAESQRVPLRTDFVPLSLKALSIAREAKNANSEAMVLEIIGNYYSRVDDYANAIGYLEQAIKKYKDVRNYDKLKTIYSNIAVFYRLTGDIDKSLQYNLESEALLKRLKKNELEDSLIYGNLADNYAELGYTEASIQCATRGWEIAKQYTNKNYEALSEVSLLDMLCRYGEIDKAKLHYNRLAGYVHMLEPSVRAHTTGSLLQHAFYLGYRDKADKYAQSCLAYVKNENAVTSIKKNLENSLTKYYRSKEDFDKSKVHAKEFQTMAEQAKSPSQLEEAYTQLYKIDSIQGDYLSAIKNCRIARSYTEKILTEEKAKEMARLETVFKTNEKDRDNKILKKQAQIDKTKLTRATLNKNLTLIGIIILIVSVAIVYRRYRINRRMRYETWQKSELLKNLVIEKEWLLKEIHHRVKNNLQIVMSLLNTQSHFLQDEAAKKAIKNSQDRIHSMSLIHKKLYQSDNAVSINMELYIKELVEYFKATFDTKQRIKFTTDIEPVELTSTQAVPLGLIINEAIINAIKHGFPYEKEGNIYIELKTFSDNRIQLFVKDNGIGVTDIENLTQSTSLGIKLIQGFSKELNAELEFQNNNGLAIAIFFNKHYENKASA